MDIVGICTAILTTITILIGFFNKEQKKYENCKQRYFEELLLVFMQEYKKDKNIDSINFINARFMYADYFVPMYIFYLVDCKEEKVLKKILLVDYIQNFPTARNVIFNALDGIFHRITFIFILVYIVALISVSYMLTFCIIKLLWILVTNLFSFNVILIQGTLLGLLKGSFLSILFFLTMYCIYTGLRDSINSNDEYTLNIKNIQKIIKRKEKIYDKGVGKYLLLTDGIDECKTNK